MNVDIEQLVAEVADITGAAPPEVLGDDAPVPTGELVAGERYYVGLIGGKDVGKTSLVNAIAGTTVAEPTGHGEGTRTVVAYCHRDVADEVRVDLAALGEKLEVVPHDVPELRRQVLLDLPDIDSKYADHIQLTRRMLRNMLYPVWVQSIEKYADHRPRELLLQVATGNDPANFLFVLSKVDQLVDREGRGAADELAADYAARLQRALKLADPPKVLICSARRPEEYDLPRLRDALGVERTASQVEVDRGKAQRRQLVSIADWVERQNLAGRVAASQRLLEEAEDALAERVGVPILEQALPRLEQDAGHRMTLAEPAAKARARAWPIVGWIDAALSPIVALVRRNLTPASSEAAALEQHLADTGQSTAKNLRAAFAQLHGAYPAVAEVYARRRLWEAPESEAATSALRRRLDAALRLQREHVAERLTPSRWFAPVRWLLTVGVVLWFVIVQPLLTIFLPQDTTGWSFSEFVIEAVALLSAQALLASAGFVVGYLLILWGAIRMKAYRDVAAWRKRLGKSNSQDADASPAAQTMIWMQELLDPLQQRHNRLAALATKAETLRTQTRAAA